LKKKKHLCRITLMDVSRPWEEKPRPQINMREGVQSLQDREMQIKTTKTFQGLVGGA
jgi:hypothetical protein